MSKHPSRDQRAVQRAQARDLPLEILLAEVIARGYQVIPPFVTLPPTPFEVECEVEIDDGGVSAACWTRGDLERVAAEAQRLRDLLREDEDEKASAA